MNSVRIFCGAACVLGLALLGVGRASAAGASPARPAVRAAIDRIVANARHTYGGRTPLPAVLIGVWTPRGSYVRAYGDADLATRRALTQTDHFRIGSNTKTFVISVLLQLVDEGYLSLDDPLSKFPIGVTIPNAQNVTVRELCEMRSGLFEAYDTPQVNRINGNGNTKFDSRTLIRWAVAQKPLFAPGTKYNYSNTNYLILGLVIETLTHDSAAHQIALRLIDRFGLTQTSYPSTQAMPAPWTHGYGLAANKTWSDVSGTIPVSLMGPAGAMISTMRDMRRWTQLYVMGKTNGAVTQRARLTCLPTGDGNLSFGLGIGCSAGYFGYTGGLPGYNTANWYNPGAHTMIVAWVTVQTDSPPPGAANLLVSNIARLVTPHSIPFVLPARPPATRSGL